MRKVSVYTKPQQGIKKSPQAVDFSNFRDRLMGFMSNNANTQRMFQCAQFFRRLGRVDFRNEAFHA